MGADLPPYPEHDPDGSAILEDAIAMPVRALDAPGATAPAPDALEPASGDASWSVFYTRSNCERLLARACERRKIRHYLPLAEQWIGPDHARRRAIAPLFPSYLFVCPSSFERQSLLEIGHLTRILPVSQPDLLLVELRQIRGAIEAGAGLTVGAALERGAWVRVVHGPLAGVVGRVEGLRRRKRRHRLVLNVSVLGRGVSTEVDASEVERVQVPGDEAPELAKVMST